MKLRLGWMLVPMTMVACGGGQETTPPPEMPPAPPVAEVTPPAEPAQPAETPKRSIAELQTELVQKMAAAKDAQSMAALYAEDAVMNHPGMPPIQGRQAILATISEWYKGAPDMKSWGSRVWQSGDNLAVEWGWSGTNTGEYMGMKPTEKKIGQLGVSVITLNDQGLIKSETRYADDATIGVQMGLSKGKARPVPQPAAELKTFKSTGAPEEAKALDVVKTTYAAMDNKKVDDFLATVSDDIVYEDMTNAEASKGKPSAKKFFTTMQKAFPDMKTSITRAFAAGPYVIVEATMSGTHKGALGPLKASNKPVTIHGLDIMEVGKDGKVVRGWSYSNGMELLTQIGAAKPMMGPNPGDKADKTAKVDPKAAKPATPAQPTKN